MRHSSISLQRWCLVCVCVLWCRVRHACSAMQPSCLDIELHSWVSRPRDGMPLCKNLWTQNTVKSWLISRVGTPLYKPYICAAQKGRGFATFWSENRYSPCLFLSGIGHGFRGNYGSVWTYLSFLLKMTKKERKICKFELNLKKSFLLLF